MEEFHLSIFSTILSIFRGQPTARLRTPCCLQHNIHKKKNFFWINFQSCLLGLEEFLYNNGCFVLSWRPTKQGQIIRVRDLEYSYGGGNFFAEICCVSGCIYRSDGNWLTNLLTKYVLNHRISENNHMIFCIPNV